MEVEQAEAQAQAQRPGADTIKFLRVKFDSTLGLFGHSNESFDKF